MVWVFVAVVVIGISCLVGWVLLKKEENDDFYGSSSSSSDELMAGLIGLGIGMMASSSRSESPFSSIKYNPKEQKRRGEFRLKQQQIEYEKQIAEQKRQDNIRIQEEYARQRERKLEQEKRKALEHENEQQMSRAVSRAFNELRSGIAKISDEVGKGNENIGNAIIVNLIESPLDNMAKLSASCSLDDYKIRLDQQKNLLELCRQSIRHNKALKERISNSIEIFNGLV